MFTEKELREKARECIQEMKLYGGSKPVDMTDNDKDYFYKYLQSLGYGFEYFFENWDPAK